MSDFSRSFHPWENHFTKGLYLAGVECAPDAEPPAGWSKWVMPGFEYLRVLITDLDGTLLRKDKSNSQCTVQALDACRKKGILLAFATARSEMEARRFVNRVHPDILIFNGGAGISCRGEVIYRKMLCAETVRGIVSMCR